MKSLKATLPLLELSALVGVGLWALLFQARLPSKLPSEDDYRAAAQVLEREAKPGDVVLLFPWWAERARLFVPPNLPVVGYLGSDRDSLAAHPRIWVLGQPDLPGSDRGDFERAFLPARTRVGEERAFGDLALSLWKNGRYRRTLFSAADAIARASVYVEQPGGEKTPCPFDGKAHRCAGNGALYVAPEWHAINFEPRRCLWFRPPGGPARLVAELPDVPAGAYLSLEGGLVWDRGYFHGGGYTATNLGVDDAKSGERLLDLSIPPGLEGVQHAEARTSPGGPRTLKLWSQSDNAELRELCLDLLSQGPEGEGNE